MFIIDSIGKEEENTVEEEEAGPSGMDAEDEGRILAVTIHRTDKLKNDFYIMHPMVRVHILDELTGKYLPKQHKYVQSQCTNFSVKLAHSISSL